MRPRVQECQFCGEEFMNDTTNLRLYCSKVCQITNRKDKLKNYNRDHYRLRSCTIARYTKILKEEGYEVIKIDCR